MALVDVLSISEDTISVKSDLHTTMVTLAAAATQLALMSLERADLVLDAAIGGEPIIGSVSYIGDSKKYATLASQVMASADVMVKFLCAANENMDDEVNENYAKYLSSVINTGPIDAILYEAQRKINVALNSIPETLEHASRFNGSIYEIPGEQDGN